MAEEFIDKEIGLTERKIKKAERDVLEFEEINIDNHKYLEACKQSITDLQNKITELEQLRIAYRNLNKK